MMTLRTLPKNVIALGVVSALNDMASEIAIRTIPLFLNNVLGVKTGLIGLIEGIAEASATLVKAASGMWSDKLGRRKPLALSGFALSNVMKPLLLLAQSWQAVLVLRFLDRAGKGIRTAPRDALLAESVSENERGRAFGFNRSMDPLGAIAGLVLAAILVHSTGGDGRMLSESAYRTLVLLATVPGAACVIVLAVAVKEPAARSPVKKVLTLRGTLPPGLRKFLLAVFIFNLSATSDAFLVLRAQELGLPLWGIFLLLGVLNLVITLVAFPAGVISDFIGRRGLMVGGWLVFAALLAGFAFATKTWHVALLFVGYGVYLGLTEGVEKAWLADLAPAQSRGTAFGYLQLAVGAAALPASLLTGLVWQRFGSQGAFLAGGAIALAGAMLLLIYGGKRPLGAEALPPESSPSHFCEAKESK